jgi:hypothetical protein
MAKNTMEEVPSPSCSHNAFRADKAIWGITVDMEI